MLELKITTGSPEELQQAAETIAAFVLADKTEPTRENRDAWVSDLELRTKLELPLGREKGQWEWVYGICVEAAKTLWMTNRTLSGATLLVLMALNAARRFLNPNPATIENLIRTARAYLDGVGMEPGPRKNRLESLLDYGSVA